MKDYAGVGMEEVFGAGRVYAARLGIGPGLCRHVMKEVVAANNGGYTAFEPLLQEVYAGLDRAAEILEHLKGQEEQGD